MPRKTEWTHRIPAAIEELSSLPCPTIDRLTVQSLFGVSPRQALRILDRLGAYRAGQCLLLGREELLLKLESLLRDEHVQFEKRRRERVVVELNRERRNRGAQAVSIPLRRDAVEPDMSMLPAGVVLAEGQLRIDFSDAEDLLGKLFQFSQAVADDYEMFLRLVSRRNDG